VRVSAYLRRRWEKNWPEAKAALRGGLPPFVVARDPLPLRSAVPVFVYHVPSAEVLRADLAFLARNRYVTLGADALLDHLRGTVPAPPGAVVLSVDDGAVHLYHTVFPLLREYGARAVAFVAPRFHPLRASEPAPDEARPCSWDELREMDESGHVDVQSHTLEHRYVPRWPEPVRLAGVDTKHLHRRREPLPMIEDFRASRDMIEAALDKRVRHLAFPRFDGTPVAVSVARDAGFEAAWWGPIPGHPLNRPGDDGSQIARLSGEFLRRLPGRDRLPLHAVLRSRYGAALSRHTAGPAAGAGPR
jgi:peptidoglycan/xylan/chitin deacetylase (PgdA/CDA1 family)